MPYKKVSGSRTAEIQLDGSVYTVDFGCSYNYYAVRNDSDSTIYVSTTDKSCTPNNDGVVSIPSGGGYVHYNGFGGSSEIFISGTGGALVIAQDDGVCPFKRAAKGGDGNAELNILPHSEGLTYYFDYQRNITPSSWTDIISGYEINNGVVQSADYVELNKQSILSWSVKNTFTAYCICKCISNTIDTVGVFGTENNADNDWFMLVRTPKNTVGMVFGARVAGHETTIPSSDYHICAWSFFEGKVFFYIDGSLIITKTECQTLDRWLIGVDKEGFAACFKMIAFYENVAQGKDAIIENSRYIAQKYGIQI